MFRAASTTGSSTAVNRNRDDHTRHTQGAPDGRVLLRAAASFCWSGWHGGAPLMKW
jgi:hypothetical protein